MFHAAGEKMVEHVQKMCVQRTRWKDLWTNVEMCITFPSFHNYEEARVTFKVGFDIIIEFAPLRKINKVQKIGAPVIEDFFNTGFEFQKC